MFSPVQTQMEVFIAQIELANKYNLPLYLHERDAHDDFYNVLSIYKAKYPNLKSIVHCFTGKKEHLIKYIELGFYIGITGWICDNRRNTDLIEAIKCLPIDKLILETDSPFLIPFEYGKKWNTRHNQPDSLEYIVNKISEIIDKPKSKIINKTIENYKKLFGL
jgi:TatD DNase family protein